MIQDHSTGRGGFKIIKVSDRESVTKAKLSVDQLQNDRHVSLTPR